MERDPAVFLLGEDIGPLGGAFKVTAGFLEHCGERRVVDTPIAESAIVGAASWPPDGACGRWRSTVLGLSSPGV